MAETTKIEWADDVQEDERVRLLDGTVITLDPETQEVVIIESEDDHQQDQN